jgi:hypothetical protein
MRRKPKKGRGPGRPWKGLSRQAEKAKKRGGKDKRRRGLFLEMGRPKDLFRAGPLKPF